MSAEADLAQLTTPTLVHSDRTVRDTTKRGTWERFISKIWDSDYYDKSEAERRLVVKLDCFLLPALTLGWWVKNLDQSNLSNAYVSGMKEELHILGNQYTYMTTIYSAVLAGMQLPGPFIALKIRPSYFLAASEIGWTIFTFAQAGAENYQSMYGFRFCVALFESTYYPVSYYLLGSWYTRRELGKRTALWYVASPAGGAFSGYLQAAIYKNMDGLSGLAGWRWLYIICGIISLPVGVAIFLLVPDFPSNTQVWYLNEEERDLAKLRLVRDGRDPVRPIVTRKVIFSALRNWRFWLCVPFFTTYALSGQVKGQFGVYLKAYGYDVTLRNILPATTSLIEIPTLALYASASDRLVRFGRGWVILAILLWRLLPNSILCFWPKSNPLRVAAFLISGSTDLTPIFFAWVAEICQNDAVERAFVTGSITAFWYTTDAWINTIIWKQTDGPRFKIGFTSAWGLLLVTIAMVPVMHYFERRDRRRIQELEQPGGTYPNRSIRYEQDDPEDK